MNHLYRHPARRSAPRWTPPVVLLLMLVLPGCGGSGTTPGGSHGSPRSDTEILASDDRFSGTPLAISGAREICDRLRDTASEEWETAGRPRARYPDGTNRNRCAVSWTAPETAVTVEFWYEPVAGELRGKAAASLRKYGAGASECLLYRTDGAHYSDDLDAVDSGEFCGRETVSEEYVASRADFTMRRTSMAVSVQVSSRDQKSAGSLDEAIQVRDVMVDTVIRNLSGR